MNITFAPNVHTVRSALGDIARFREGLFGRKSRAQRDLPPYQSSKKAWDDEELAVTPLVLVPAEPSTRHMRRVRQRDLAAMGKKSRRSAARNRFATRQAEQSLRGQARVYLLGHGTPAMRETVRREIHGLAWKVSREQGEPFAASLKRIEDSLREILETYGDDV